MYTEKEAYERFCPRAIPLNAPVYAEPGYCHGSSCMAWRWWGNHSAGDNKAEGATIREEILPEMPSPDKAGYWVKGIEYTDDAAPVTMYHWSLFPKRGFCGLAGPVR